jgi:transposase
LPDRYPSYQTCHRRFQHWVRAGLLRSILEILAQALHDEGYLDLQEAFIDGSFAPAKRGGACVGKTKRGKGSKIMAIADRQGRPVAVHVESATPHEVTLVHAHSRSDFSASSQRVSSATTLTSRTDWMPNWPG